jgi:DNA-binding NarL/FixJ family response regulator
MKNIVLCSNHPMLIAGFRQVVQLSGEFSLTVCEDPALLRETMIGSQAHMVLADVNCGITLALMSTLRASVPGTAIALWIENASTEFLCQAIGLGVQGILRQNATIEICLKCLKQVSAGQLWVEEDLNKKLLRTRTIRLTPREGQLMGMLAQGIRNKELAYRLGITEGTVKVYLSRLYDKVGASDRFELALLALKNMASDQSTASKNLAGSLAGGADMVPKSVSFEQPSIFVQ